MVDVVGNKTYRGWMLRAAAAAAAAAAGDAVCLAGTGIAGPESQVGSELRRVGESWQGAIA